MKKRWIITAIMILEMLVFTGCAKKTANEEQMQTDLEDTRFHFLNESEKIEKVTVEKRQTDKEMKIDTIWCSVITTDEYISYQKDVILTYGLYDSGWILDDVSVNAFNEWIQTPLQGINENDIIDSLIGKFIIVDDDYWYFASDNIMDFSVDRHNTDLDAGTDIVTADLIVEDEVEEITGRLVVNYIFDNGWKFDSVSMDKEFVVSLKPEVSLNVTDEDLIAEISGQNFILENPEFGRVVWKAAEDMHTVSIKDDEISDFVIREQESLSKGTEQIYYCECMLNKECVTFILEIEVPYQYESGVWSTQPVDISAKCDTLNIIGEWTGIYYDAPFGGNATLNISDVDENGNLTATYSYIPSEENRYEIPGSYNVSGTIDLLTLDMNLTAGDWIEEPDNALSWTKGDVVATLCVDELVIKGIAQRGNAFEVTW